MVALIAGIGQHIMIGSINGGNVLDRYRESPGRVEESTTKSAAQLAHELAQNHINTGTQDIFEKIIERVTSEASIGRFKMIHILKNNQCHLKDNVMKQLADNGFKVKGLPTSQREPEVSLEISW